MNTQPPKIKISLTNFLDFVCLTGGPKLEVVKEVKSNPEYSPVTDFYKGLREGLINNHKTNRDIDALDIIIKKITDPKKVKNYTLCIEKYKKFLSNKSIAWFEPPSKHWQTGTLDIRVNPEIGLIYDNKHYAIKLYFKSEPLSKNKASLILTLMEYQLQQNEALDIKMAILDVRRSKLFPKEDKELPLLPLLEVEAAGFVTLWNGITI